MTINNNNNNNEESSPPPPTTTSGKPKPVVQQQQQQQQQQTQPPRIRMQLTTSHHHQQQQQLLRKRKRKPMSAAAAALSGSSSSSSSDEDEPQNSNNNRSTSAAMMMKQRRLGTKSSPRPQQQLRGANNTTAPGGSSNSGSSSPTSSSHDHSHGHGFMTNNNNTTSTATPTQQQQQQQQSNVHQVTPTTATTTTPCSVTTTTTTKPSQQQPEGWRVKLYRLNADGSWDDCGTGRIVCLYKTPPTTTSAIGSSKLQTNNNNTSATGKGNGIGVDTDAQLYEELGEPTLCMQAEIPPADAGAASSSSSTPTTPAPSSSSPSTTTPQKRVLLRTRILLRDAYQRQGDNIITWCEPYFDNSKTTVGQQQQQQHPTHLQQQQHPNKTAITVQAEEQLGVDLALSFQDNAGCLDIWRQITNVQSRAADWFRVRGQQGPPTQQQQQQQQLQQQHNVTPGVGVSSSAEDASKENDEKERYLLLHQQQQNGSTSNEQQQQQQQQQQPHHHHHHSTPTTNTATPPTNSTPPQPQQQQQQQQQQQESVTDMAHAVAAAHHVSLQRQQQHTMWMNVASEAAAAQHHLEQHHQRAQAAQAAAAAAALGNFGQAATADDQDDDNGGFCEVDAEAVAVSMAAAAAAAYGGCQQGDGQDGGGGQQGGSNANGGAGGNGGTTNQTNQVVISQGVGPNGGAASMAAAQMNNPLQLPNPPSLTNLEEIADTIAAAQMQQQRDALAMYISQSECNYLKALLNLFPAAEAKGDYGALATLAACIKTILLLNDPTIIELIVTDHLIFENVSSTLEYDPDLRDKANHRWFIRERAKFRTVVKMEDEELISTIHRSFRVTYLRDTLLRPTMDESSLSTLSSLQTFTHADLVKGVTCSPRSQAVSQRSPSATTATTTNNSESETSSATPLAESYLIKVIRLLGREVRAIQRMEWEVLEQKLCGGSGSLSSPSSPEHVVVHGDSSMNKKSPQSLPSSHRGTSITGACWKQHLAPQDGSLASRKNRRRGCLSFLRELFNMVRISLQQSDKDDFYALIVCMDVDIEQTDAALFVDSEKASIDGSKDAVDGNSKEGKPKEFSSSGRALCLSGTGEPIHTGESSNQDVPKHAQHPGSSSERSNSAVNLLSLLGSVLSDPTADVSEKGAVLEIISAIAMHDPSHIRRHCLDYQELWKEEQERKSEKGLDMTGPVRPQPNDRRQVIFRYPPDDLLTALLFLLAVETDAGLLLQVSEIMRIILDTDMLGEHGPMGAGLGTEDNESVPPGGIHPSMDHPNGPMGGQSHSGSDQNQFLAMFYENYVQWLAAPFQFTILHPVKLIPDAVFSRSPPSLLMQRLRGTFKAGVSHQDRVFRLVPPCAIRSSFAVELLSFCVRAHLYRMKFFLLRSRVLGNMLKFLTPGRSSSSSGDRCLKLAVLRFLRAILSVKDEFYHRHIIQHNLFAPVFEAFRANPVGDNLVSSAIIEMVDYIHNTNIKSLIEYIVTKHLHTTSSNRRSPKSSEELSLEDVATPYVNTLTVLRQAYEENKDVVSPTRSNEEGHADPPSPNSHSSRYFPSMARPRVGMSEKALEDQRKFREVDEEESYFETDDDDGQQVPEVVTRGAVDEVAENELHRTPRMFSLSQAPLLNSTTTSLGGGGVVDGDGGVDAGNSPDAHDKEKNNLGNSSRNADISDSAN